MDILSWLLEGDVSLQYLTHRDFLHSDARTLEILQQRISKEGFCARFLACRKVSGHWGIHFYQPKWTCTHYTLHDLKNLGIEPGEPACQEMVARTFRECQRPDGSLNLAKSDLPSDIGINGMVLEYAAYFAKRHPGIPPLIDWLLSVQREDGSYAQSIDPADYTQHLTMCVLDGFGECLMQGMTYRIDDVLAAERRMLDYFLRNRLFVNHEDRRYRRLTFQFRYRFDLLHILDYCAKREIAYDECMHDALSWLAGKRQEVGAWVLEYTHPGNVHFAMETTGQPSRFITLKAERIRSFYATGRE